MRTDWTIVWRIFSEELLLIAYFQGIDCTNFTSRSDAVTIHNWAGLDDGRGSKIQASLVPVPLRSVYNTSATVTLSSDWDVSTINPFVGIQNAISRGHQSVSVKDAVEMYTINAAFAMRQENIVGSLKTGKDADFIVIDTDILDPGNADVISQTRVLRTFLAGKEVWADDQSPIDDVTCRILEEYNYRQCDSYCYNQY